jgi:Flp pilus assembly protein CpaB
MEYAQKLLQTRRGTTIAGAAAAVLAGLVLLLYLNQYRNSVNESGSEMTVLVAKSLIEKGTPGSVVGTKELFQTTEAPQAQLKDGAITDPATMRGRIAVRDIYPGQQITLSDFSASTTDALGTRIVDTQRAISVPLDSAHGMVDNVEAGDHVDVFVGFNVVPLVGPAAGKAVPVIKVLLQDALVLESPKKHDSGTGSGDESNVVLRASRDQAAQIAWAVDNGKVWIVLRPRAGAAAQKPAIVNAESVLLGIKPVTVYRNARKLLRGQS